MSKYHVPHDANTRLIFKTNTSIEYSLVAATTGTRTSIPRSGELQKDDAKTEF